MCNPHAGGGVGNCPGGSVCLDYGAPPFYGTINFDTFFSAWVMFFMCITGEGCAPRHVSLHVLPRARHHPSPPYGRWMMHVMPLPCRARGALTRALTSLSAPWLPVGRM